RMAIDCEPLFHHAAGPWLETLADALVDELVDARFRDLHDKRGGGRHHREDLAVHLQRARAEPLSRLAGHVALAAHGGDDARQSRIVRSIPTFGRSRRRLSSLPPP